MGLGVVGCLEKKDSRVDCFILFWAEFGPLGVVATITFKFRGQNDQLRTLEDSYVLESMVA